jgi:thiol-disulfide isomerase/thioredoxin
MQHLARLAILLLLPLLAVCSPVDEPLSGLDGSNHRLSDYRGNWVVVNYWATWCPPCLEEMPELNLFHEINSDNGIIVVGINLEDVTNERLRRFVADHSITFPILRPENSSAPPFGPIPGLPTTLLLSPQGELVARKVGRVTTASLERMIEQAKSKR